MNKLKPCPFCGAKAVLKEVASTKTFCKEMKHEEEYFGWDLLQSNCNSGKPAYTYRVQEYIPQCLDPRCFGRCNKRFPNKIRAINAWNRRAGDEA